MYENQQVKQLTGLINTSYLVTPLSSCYLLHCQHHVLKEHDIASYCFAAVQHRITDTSKSDTEIRSIIVYIGIAHH